MIATSAFSLFGIKSVPLTCGETDPLRNGLSVLHVLEVPVVSVMGPATSFQYLDHSAIVTNVKIKSTPIITTHVESVSSCHWWNEVALKTVGMPIAGQRVRNLGFHGKGISVLFGIETSPIAHERSRSFVE
jgi:hypothetical protein